MDLSLNQGQWTTITTDHTGPYEDNGMTERPDRYRLYGELTADKQTNKQTHGHWRSMYVVGCSLMGRSVGS